MFAALSPRLRLAAVLLLVGLLVTLAVVSVSHPGTLHLLPGGPDIMSNHF
jgi:hypothetical protein